MWTTPGRLAPIFAAVFTVFCIACSSPADKGARFLKRGKAALAAKDYARADLEFRNAIQVLPNDAEAYYQSALAALGRRDMSAAASYLKKATDLNPAHGEAQLKLATLMATSSSKQTLADAAERARGVLKESPDNASALEVLASTELRFGNVQSALDLLERAFVKAPQNVTAAMNLAKVKASQHDVSGAEQVLLKLVRESPQSAPAALALAQFQILTGKNAEGEEQALRARKLDPGNTGALLLLGSLQSSSGRQDQAAETYRELSESPNFRTVYPLYLAHVGKRREAVAELERLNRKYPEDRGLRGMLVTAYVSQARSAEAGQILATALRRNPKDTDALVQRADLAIDAGNYKDAEQDLKTVLHLAPTIAEAHYLQARIYSVAGSPLQERQKLDEALRLSPNLLIARIALSTLLVRTNQLRDALEVLDKAPVSQKTSAAFITARNWAWIANGNPLEARKSLDAALPTMRTVDLLYQDALLKISQKQYSSGRNSLQEILRNQPENISALRLLVSSHAAETGLPKALATLREYADSRPKSAPLRTLYGGWLSLAGKGGDARAAFSEARNLDKKYGPAAIALGEMDFADGKLDDVRKDLAPVLEGTPGDPGARLLLAMTEQRAGNRAAAIAHYRAVIDREPKNQRALNNIALAMVPDDLDEALKYAQAAVEVDPNDASAEDTLGWILYQKGAYANAAKYLKQAVSTQVNPTRQFHLGMTYIKLGDTQQARELMNEALKQDPKLAITEVPLVR